MKARIVGEHHLCLAFRADGQVDFYPTTENPHELARRFAELIRLLVEHPSTIGCAAGAHVADQEPRP